MTDLPAPIWAPLNLLKPADWNPREISPERFENLKVSIQRDPEYIKLRPILATMDGTIFSGNMRYRAVWELGWETVPAIMVDIPEDVAKRRAIQENKTWGSWDQDRLGEMVYTLKLQDDADVLGFTDSELSAILGSVSDLGEEAPISDPPLRCSKCGQIIQEDPSE
jgi:ParB-like chromosome segregation protein Spo0J